MPADILALLVLDKPLDGKLRAVGDHAVLGRSSELRPIGLGFSRKCDDQATRKGATPKGAPYKSVRKCVTLDSDGWIHILFCGMLLCVRVSGTSFGDFPDPSGIDKSRKSSCGQTATGLTVAVLKATVQTGAARA